MSCLNEKPIALADVLKKSTQSAASSKSLKAFFSACLDDVENAYIKTLKDYGVLPKTLADMAAERPKLLSGEFSSCSHNAYGFGSSSEVSDETGKYLRLVGDCRKCKSNVVAIQEISDNQPS
jgi:hypothetical protein